MDAANEKQWHDFWRRLGAGGDPSRLWQRLAAAYSESWRRYHNLKHIGHCLDEFATAAHLARYPLTVEAAIWFHDFVYDTYRRDNEERSAEVAETELGAAGMKPDFLDSVRRLILATKHASPPAPNDAALLTDIDLSILGQAPEAYAEFERQIRDEYSWASDSDFSIGRSTILKSFLARPDIFTTKSFRQKYEAQARLNLEWAIKRMAG